MQKNIRLNQFGNLPAGTLDRLKGRSEVFIGKVRLKSGEVISSVWQRPPSVARQAVRRGVNGNSRSQARGAQTGLKLLIRFEDPLPVKKHLGYEARSRDVVNKNLGPLLGRALAKAITTRK